MPLSVIAEDFKNKSFDCRKYIDVVLGRCLVLCLFDNYQDVGVCKHFGLF